MKRLTQLTLGCVGVLLAVTLVAAQQVPQPVVRLGEWVEVGNEVWMNIIAHSDIRYQTTHEYDFEKRVQDRVRTRDPLATIDHGGEGDFVWVENRFGVDFRYQKSLLLQVLLEHQSVMDGNTIDNVRGTVGPAQQTFNDGQTLGVSGQGENNYFNVERYWIDYTFPGKLDWLRMRVGADLWLADQGGIVGDDDPRFALFATFGAKKEWQIDFSAVIQNEAYRLGLQNDNDYIYYFLGVSYDWKPYKFDIHGVWFRDRFTGAHGQPNVGQKTDSFLIMPSVSGAVGPLKFFAEGMFVFGNVEGGNATDCDAVRAGFQRCDYDVWSWGAVAMLQLDLGFVKPFAGIIYGSADDDPTDDKLEGFAPVPHREITTITSAPLFGRSFDTMAAFGARDVPNPARSRGLAGANTGNQGGTEFRHSVGNPFSDRIGNVAHPGTNITYSNPGTLIIPAGLDFTPVKGHDVILTYAYVGVIDSRLVELAFNAPNVSNTMYHEVQLQYMWAPSPYFDIRLTGGAIIPADGVKDVAATADCDFTPGGFRACNGDDIALRGEARIRARF